MTAITSIRAFRDGDQIACARPALVLPCDCRQHLAPDGVCDAQKIVDDKETAELMLDDGDVWLPEADQAPAAFAGPATVAWTPQTTDQAGQNWLPYAGKPTLTLNQIIEQLQTSWGGDHEGCHFQWGGTQVTYSISAPTAGLTAFARDAFEMWDDLIAIDLNEVTGPNADIDFAYVSTVDYAATSSDKDDPTFDHADIKLNDTHALLADRMIANGTIGNPDGVRFGSYGFKTYVHEIGHSLGLSHSGSYDASDEGDETYAEDAEYKQDTRQYTIMSYFEAGADGSPADHDGSEAASPLLHDIAAIQAKYGADMTTRTGNDVYGFNSDHRRPRRLRLPAEPQAGHRDLGCGRRRYPGLLAVHLGSEDRPACRRVLQHRRSDRGTSRSPTT